MENISRLWGANRPQMETIDLIESTEEMKNFFHQDDREITWIIDKHHKRNNP